MPEHLRALFVILVLSTAVFWLVRQPVSEIISKTDFTRRRNLWLTLTVLAFLSYSFWVYAALTTLLVTVTIKKENNPLALYFLLLFLIPPVSAQIPGFGLINYIFSLNHVRLLALVILLPVFFTLIYRKDILTFGHIWPDKLIATYLLVSLTLLFRNSNITGVMRDSLYLFLDIFLPYYVISRLASKIDVAREAIASFFIAILTLAAIGFFEFTRNWLLYTQLVNVMGLDWGYTTYLGRSGNLRANATAGQAIPLGFIMATGLGLFTYLRNEIPKSIFKKLLTLLLTIGLISPLSRGPWVGAATIVFVFVATGQNATKQLTKLFILTVTALFFLSQIPAGQKIVDHLPFIGTVEEGGIDYRAQLLKNSLNVIERNLWIGSSDYLQTPEMQEMIQGQGIIDIVNTYVGIALDKGLIGLVLFIGFFISVILSLVKTMRQQADKNHEAYCLGRALLATQVGILVIIGTTSSITFIPVVCWSIAGLSVAYTQIERWHQMSHPRSGITSLDSK